MIAVALPVYTYLIADLATNTVLDEIPLAGAKFSKPMNDSGTLQAEWNLDLSPATGQRDPYDLTTPTRRVVYALRDDRPMWGGIIWTRKYDSTTKKVSIGAGEFLSYYDHRFILPVLALPAAIDYVAGLSTAYAGVDQNEIARRLLAQAHAATGGDILLELDDTTSGIFRDRTYDGFSLKNLGSALRELAGVDEGQDLVTDVTWPAPGTAAPRRILRQGEPTLGQQGSAWVFEHPGNVLSYTWPSDGTAEASRAYAVGDGVDQGMPIAVAEDTSRYATGWPLLESEAQYTGVQDPATLTAHATADQFAARLPVVLPELVVRGDVHPTAAEVDRGDDARVVIQPDEFFHREINTSMRVVQLDFAPSENAEQVTLTMAPLLDDVA